MPHGLEVGVFGETHPVEVTGTLKIEPNVYTRNEAAEYGYWSTYTFTGTETQPVAICQRDEYRSRVLVMVTVAGAGGAIFIGPQTAFSKPGAPQGGKLFTGAIFEMKNQQPMYVVPDGINPATVTVLIERYDAYPDDPIIEAK